MDATPQLSVNGHGPARSEAVLLTVLIPCYNEAAILANSLCRLVAYLEADDWRGGRAGAWEVLLVNDGSKDGTDALLREWAARDARIRYVSYAPNGGQGKALQRGFAAAQGEWIICLDADLDYGPAHIAQLLAVAQERSADIVIGSPFIAGGAMRRAAVRYWMSRTMNWYFSKVLRIGVSTYTAILPLYRRQAIQGLLLTSFDKDVLPEILIKAHLLGLVLVEVPATLAWDRKLTQQRGKGIGLGSTAGKALRHILWGVIENPLAFFLVPASCAGFLTLWFGLALLIVFSRNLAAAPGGLQGLTEACHHTVVTAPQTCIIFALAFHATLILFSIGILVFQNKVKKQQDFIYFTKLYAALERRGTGRSRDTDPSNISGN